ncbi:MAG: hypothetical protein Q9165_008292 [Trypethelium subeluteriae]
MARLQPMPSFSDFDGTHYEAPHEPEGVISPIELQDLERNSTTNSEASPEPDQQDASSSIAKTPPEYEGYPRPKSEKAPLLPHTVENPQLPQQLAQTGPSRESFMCENANDAALFRQAASALFLPKTRYSQAKKLLAPSQANGRADFVSLQEADTSFLYTDEGEYPHMPQEPRNGSNYLERQEMPTGRDKPERLSNEGQDEPRQPLPETQRDPDNQAIEDRSARESPEFPSNEGQHHRERSSDLAQETVSVEGARSKAMEKEFEHPVFRFSVQMDGDSSEALVSCETTESQEIIAPNGTPESTVGSPAPHAETQLGDVQSQVDRSSSAPPAPRADTLHMSIGQVIEQAARRSSNATAREGSSSSQPTAQAPSRAQDPSSTPARTASIGSLERPSPGSSESVPVALDTSTTESPRAAQEIAREPTTRAPSPSPQAPPSQRQGGESSNQGRKRSSSETIRAVQAPGQNYGTFGPRTRYATVEEARNARFEWARRLAHPFGGPEGGPEGGAEGGSGQEGDDAGEISTSDEGVDEPSRCQRFFSCIAGPVRR